MWNGESHVLGAASAADRSLWLHAINCIISGDDSDGLHEDDEESRDSQDDDDDDVEDDDVEDDDDDLRHRVGEDEDEEDEGNVDDDDDDLCASSARLKLAPPQPAPVVPQVVDANIAFFSQRSPLIRCSKGNADRETSQLVEACKLPAPKTRAELQAGDSQVLKRRLLSVSARLAEAHESQTKSKLRQDECDSVRGDSCTSSSAGSQLSVASGDSLAVAKQPLIVEAVVKTTVAAAAQLQAPVISSGASARLPPALVHRPESAAGVPSGEACKVRKRVTFDLSAASQRKARAGASPTGSSSELESNSESASESESEFDDKTCGESADRNPQLGVVSCEAAPPADTCEPSRLEEKDDDESICEMIRNLIAQRRTRLAVEAEARRCSFRAEPMECVPNLCFGNNHRDGHHGSGSTEDNGGAGTDKDCVGSRPETLVAVQDPPRPDTASLELRLRDAHERVNDLETKLRESHSARADLCKSFDELRNDFATRNELHAQQVRDLQRRVDELGKELAHSERQLIAARHKLAKCQLANTGTAATFAPQLRAGCRRLALQQAPPHLLNANYQRAPQVGAKLLKRSKQIERKLCELENKVDAIVSANDLNLCKAAH